MRRQYEADADAEAGGDSGPRQQRDYSLKEGQTLHIALPDKVPVAFNLTIMSYGLHSYALCMPSLLRKRALTR